jgi:hypothetical protein
MPLEVDKPYLVLRTGMKDGKLVALVMDGDCDNGLLENKPRLSLRTGMKDGKQVQLVGDQHLDGNGKLILNKPYLALRTGMKDGKVVVLVAGKQCGNTFFGVCECSICCTLDATIELGDGTAWDTPVDVTLTCGGQIPFTTCYSCLNDEIEDDTILVVYENYIRGTTQTAVPFSGPGPWGLAGSGTYDSVSEVWSSPEFEIDGATYQLHFWALEIFAQQTSPTVQEGTICYHGFTLKRYYEPPDFSPYWGTIHDWDDTGGAAAFASPFFEFEYNPVYDPGPCPEGYSENGGDCVDSPACDAPPPGYSLAGSTDSAFCDEEDGTYIISSAEFFNGGPTLKCARVSIFDNCEPA